MTNQTTGNPAEDPSGIEDFEFTVLEVGQVDYNAIACIAPFSSDYQVIVIDLHGRSLLLDCLEVQEYIQHLEGLVAGLECDLL